MAADLPLSDLVLVVSVLVAVALVTLLLIRPEDRATI